MTAAGFTAQPCPPVARPAAWRFPAPDLFTLDSGLTVWLRDMPGQHVAAISCHLRAWADDEPPELAGVTAIMAATLNKGTQLLDAARFADSAAAIGMSWSSAPSYTGPIVTCQLPARHLNAGLGLLGQALAQPAFAPGETSREVQAAMVQASAVDANPPGRLMRLLPAAIYGDDLPAGRPLGGTPATLSKVTSADVRACYDAHVRPATTTVVIAGDLRGMDTADLALRALGCWRDASPPQPFLSVAPLPRRAPGAILAARPGAPQAWLVLAARIPGRDHDDWPALSAAAHLLGAPVTGRLDARLREQAGISYGIRAVLAEPVPGSGLLLVSGAVAATHAVPALCEIIAIVDALGRDGVSSAELALAVAAITRTVPLAYESAAAVAATTTSLAVGGLPTDFPGELLAAVAGLTAARVTDAVRAHLHPDRLAVLVSGDPGVLDERLADLVFPASLHVI